MTNASSGQGAAGSAPPELVDDLVTASRILAHFEVVDAFGHVSVRHPADPNRLT